MLITESQLGTGFGRSGMSLLENMSYLTEEESQYHAAMVPIVENTTIGANVVALEDIMKFSESNGIEDLGYALSMVCEASHIEANTVAFSVQETSIIADQDVANLVSDIMNEGAPIVAVPLSSYDPAYTLAESAIDYMLETGDQSLLEEYINDDFVALEATVYKRSDFDANGNYIGKAKDGKPKGKQMNLGVSADAFEKGRNQAAAERRRADVDARKAAMAEKLGVKLTGNAEEDAKTLENARKARAISQAANASAPEAPAATATPAAAAEEAKKTESFLEKIKKNAIDKPRDWIAKKIAALNTMMRKYLVKEKQADPNSRGIFSKIKAMLAKAIEFLTRHLNNAMQKVGATTGHRDALNLDRYAQK